MKDYSMMDPALEILSTCGPDLRNGMTSHAPMAVEALAAMGRPDAVTPWLDHYRDLLLPRPEPRARIPRDGWRDALGNIDRVADWSAFFADELRAAQWRDVVDRWTARFAPGICASALHGVIRVGHAARSLAESESPLRIAELADALGYWASTYQTLPAATGAPGTMSAHEAIRNVPVVPPAERKFTGTIVSSLEALDGFPAFAPVIGLIDTAGSLDTVLSDLTETFARVYLANARDMLSTIVFIHGVTGAAAVRSLLPHLSRPTAAEATRYVWQAGSALYAAFATTIAPAADVDPPRESPETLVDMAVGSGDEHAIKMTEACLREHALRPSSAYLAAARHAVGMLRAG